MANNKEDRRTFFKASALGIGGGALLAAWAGEAPAAEDARAPRTGIKDREKIAALLTGCFIPLPTLFHGRDLDVNLKEMQRHVRFLLDGGVRQGNGVLLTGGSAGEFTSLSVAERLQIAEAVLEAAAGKVGVIVGAQSANPREVIALVRGAAKLGAAAVQVSPPFYQIYSDDDVVAFFKSVSEAADIGIVIYATYWERYKISFDTLGRLLLLPNVVGLKWAAPSAYEYHKGLREFAKRTLIIDNQLSFVLSHMLGARGIDTHPSNYWPEWGVRLWGLLEDGKYKEAEDSITKVLMPSYDLISEIMQFTGGEGSLDKLCMELIGFEAGPPRPPIREFRDKFRDKARKLLRDSGVPRVTKRH